MAQGQETLYPRVICRLFKMTVLNTDLAGQGAVGSKGKGWEGSCSNTIVCLYLPILGRQQGRLATLKGLGLGDDQQEI